MAPFARHVDPNLDALEDRHLAGAGAWLRGMHRVRRVQSLNTVRALAHRAFNLSKYHAK